MRSFNFIKRNLDSDSSPATRPDTERGVSRLSIVDGGTREDRTPAPSGHVTSTRSCTTLTPPSVGVVHDLNVASEHSMHDALVLLSAVATITELTAKVLAVTAALRQRDDDEHSLGWGYDADVICVDAIRRIMTGGE